MDHRSFASKISLRAAVFVLSLALLFPLTGQVVQGAPLAQSIGVSPSSGPPGTSVTINGSGFTPGDYQGKVLWDGSPAKNFHIPDGGSFSVGFTIPSGASTGNHLIEVCSASTGSCSTGEFEQRDGVSFKVTAPGGDDEPAEDPTPEPSPTPVATLNLQPAGIEVTQGIRQDIPSRGATGDLVLRTDDWTHVGGRKTIVRVYPLVVEGPTTYATAKLYGKRDGEELPGSPLMPERLLIIPPEGASLEEMRGDANLSWNFVLPESWTEAGEISLTATVNPEGAHHVRECPGCDDDNTAYLGGVAFNTIQMKDIWVYIIRTDWWWRADDGSLQHDMAELGEIMNMIGYWLKTWPVDADRFHLAPMRIAHISHGDADPPIFWPPNWDNAVFHDWFGHLEAPPFGTADRPNRSTDPYTYIPTVFDPDSAIIGCSGQAGIGYPPLFHTGACWAATQEAGHSVGLNHASNAHGEESGGPVDPAYPGAHGQIEEDAFGFDIYAMQAIPPDLSCEDHTHDFMSYGCATKWVSVYTWQNLVEAFVSENARLITSSAQDPYIPTSYSGQPTDVSARAAGQINPDGSISLSPIMLRGAGFVEPDTEALDTDYHFEVRDAEGEVLYSRPFAPQLLTHSPDGTLFFYEPFPLVEGRSEIVFFKGDSVIGSAVGSAHAPEVTLLEPTGGAEWGAEGQVNLSWEGSDADDDTLIYRVEGSPDDGQTWRLLVGDITETEAELDLSTIPGEGGEWTIRVQASDGFHVATDEVSPIQVASKPPQAWIVQPTMDDVFSPLQTITLFGLATDWTDGPIPEDNLEWLLDGDSVGVGKRVTVEDLSKGDHELTLRAANSAGMVGEMSIIIHVDDDTDFDGLPNSWEREYGLDHLDPSDAKLDLDDDSLLTWQEFEAGSDPTVADTDDDGFSDNDEAVAGTDPADAESKPGHMHTGHNPSGTIHEGDEHVIPAVTATPMVVSGVTSADQDNDMDQEAEAPEEAETQAEQGSPTRFIVLLSALVLVAVALIGIGFILFRRNRQAG